ncbi:hypothetical protein RJE46_24460 (plasmid) [Cedecea neteri]|uniref:hypothetical protein n=1 Tax=Cedecea neteri TaxID=158822 RepID=UPI002892EFC7|nr:hypothetical protein [Cedecea neteri]WNJ82233.1 hypothetical protein RJE46_24460 [Cedecea neteri]
MDILKALEVHAGERKPALLNEDQPKVLTYIETILNESSRGTTVRQKGIIELFNFMEAVDSGNMEEIHRSIDDNDALIQRLHGGNLPSKTGKPSGKGRGNAV